MTSVTVAKGSHRKATRLLVAALVVITAASFRGLVAKLGGFGPPDLARYELMSGVEIPNFYEQLPFFLTWTRGDGQMFMTIAADPFLEGPARNLGSPVYRYGRAGYSWVASLLVLGIPSLLPVGLFATNLIATAFYAVSVVRLAEANRKAWWLLANPAIFIGVTSDTAEPFGLALVMIALLSYSPSFCVLAAGAAGLVRESFGTILGFAQHPLLAFAAAALSAISIRVAAAGSLDQSPTQGLGSLDWPLKGYLDAIPSMELASAIITVCVGLAMVFTTLRSFSPGSIWSRMSWFLTGMLGLCVSSYVIDNVVNLFRALGMVPLLWVLGMVSAEPQEGGTIWRQKVDRPDSV